MSSDRLKKERQIMFQTLGKSVLLASLLLIANNATLYAFCDYSECTHACDDQRSSDFLYYHLQCLARNNFDPAWDDYCYAEARLIADNNYNRCYQECDFCWAQDGTGSPILIQLGEGRPRISSLMDGTFFDLDGDGIQQLVAWPIDDAPFLAVDLDGSGAIESGLELFGNFSPQILLSGESPNGFAALRRYDEDGNGVLIGNELASLILWNDSDRNGISEAWEMYPVAEKLAQLDLRYHTSYGRDKHGNRFRYASAAVLVNGQHVRAIDVYFLTGD